MFKCDFWYCCKRNFTVKDETMFESSLWTLICNVNVLVCLKVMFDIVVRETPHPKMKHCLHQGCEHLLAMWICLYVLNICACMFEDAVWYCHKRDSTSKDETKFASRLRTLTDNVNLLVCWNMMFDIVVRETPHPKMKQCLHQGCEHLLTLWICLYIWKFCFML